MTPGYAETTIARMKDPRLGLVCTLRSPIHQYASDTNHLQNSSIPISHERAQPRAELRLELHAALSRGTQLGSQRASHVGHLHSPPFWLQSQLSRSSCEILQLLFIVATIVSHACLCSTPTIGCSTSAEVNHNGPKPQHRTQLQQQQQTSATMERCKDNPPSGTHGGHQAQQRPQTFPDHLQQSASQVRRTAAAVSSQGQQNAQCCWGPHIRCKHFAIINRKTFTVQESFAVFAVTK